MCPTSLLMTSVETLIDRATPIFLLSLTLVVAVGNLVLILP